MKRAWQQWLNSQIWSDYFETMSKKTITFKIQKKKEDESVVNKNNKDPFHHTETTKPSVFSDIKKKKPDVSKSVAKKSDAKESEDKLER